jgi:hypothetical protein
MYTGDKEKIYVRHRRNLEKLASYLESLPADYDHFNMTGYFLLDGLDINLSNIYNLKPKDCGSSACAIGHGPDAGIRRYNDYSWDIYSYRVYGMSHIDTNYGQYIFSSFNDDDHYDAAKRIREILEHSKEIK